MIQNKLNKNGYIISKKNLSKLKLKEIQNELSITPKVNVDYNEIPTPIIVYTENQTEIIVPKYYGIDNFGMKDVKDELDNIDSHVDFEFTGKLRETQIDVAKVALEKIKQFGGGILQLHTGYGKTTVALYLASVLKLKTLIIVHKTFLQDQWFERIKQFTTASIGMIRQKKIDVIGKDIVIGMLQSISMIDYDSEIFKDFNLVIMDECFPGYTKIMTEDGLYTIAQLYTLWKTNKKIPLIKCLNEKNNVFEYKKLTRAWERKALELTQIKFADMMIEATTSHNFLTMSGYIEAKKITEHTVLVGHNDPGKNIFTPALNSDQLQVVYGSYVGHDNICALSNGQYTLKLDCREKEYFAWKTLMFEECDELVKDQYLTTKQFNLVNDIPQNKTMCPIWVIDALDHRGITIWLLDNDFMKRYPSQILLDTHKFNEETKIRLIQKLYKFNVTPCYSTSKNYIEIYGSDVKFLVANVYKYLPGYVKDQLCKYCQLDDIYVWNGQCLGYGTCKVSSVNTVSNENVMKVYDIEVDDNHNFIVTNDTSNCGPVVHNCHHAPSRIFSRALLKICPRYTIGLSATPHRNDGLTKIIKMFLGNILVKVERKGDNAVYVKSFDYTSNDPLFTEKLRWFKGSPKPDVVKMITNMYKMDQRNIFTASIINALRLKDERKILILSGRIEHLKLLKKLVDEMIQKDIDNGICTENEFTTSFYIGQMKDYELRDSAESNVIFATYSMAEEGLDIDGLNTLVLATPKKNIIQSIGRIMRKPIKEGDINPLIVDIVDDFSCFRNWGIKRNSYYRSKQYSLTTYKAFNDKCITFKDYLLDKKMMTKDDLDKKDLDLRKEYIVKLFGMETYKFERDIKFYNFPDDMFNYNCDYSTIFEINHEYGLINPGKTTEIDFDPPEFNIEI